MYSRGVMRWRCDVCRIFMTLLYSLTMVLVSSEGVREDALIFYVNAYIDVMKAMEAVKNVSG